MGVELPLTIEILGIKDGSPVVLDRVIGGSPYLEEAKRIGERLLTIVETETPPTGYRVLSHCGDIVCIVKVGQDSQSSEIS